MKIMDTFSLNNYRLRKYLIKLLNYNQFDSGSYKKLKNELCDKYVIDLIGREDFRGLKGVDRENYLNKLMAEIQYLGDPVIKHVSYAARNLWYEAKIDNDMNKRELFTELHAICAKSENPQSRKAFNELVKSFSGASVSAMGGAGVDLTGEPLSQEEIDKAKEDAAKGKRNTYADLGENQYIVAKYESLNKDFDSFYYDLVSEVNYDFYALNQISKDHSIDRRGWKITKITDSIELSEALKSLKKHGIKSFSKDGDGSDRVEVIKTYSNSKHSTYAENEIKSFDEFKSWIHNFMKNSHPEDYSEELTNKVADDLHKKYGEDYGAMIGAAKSFMYD